MIASRTVLVVDYFFPPISSSAVQRTVGFIRHLADCGWSPVVLTVDSGFYNSYDPALLQTIPDTVSVQRTASLEPFRFAKGLLRRRPRASNGTGGGDGDRRSGFPWPGPRWIREVGKWALFPDRQIGWFPFAVARGVSVGRMRPIDIIYSSSPSNCMTSHLIAHTLKKWLRTPWVADFQDPWSPEDRYPFAMHKAVGKRIEHSILRAADRVTFTTESVRSMLARKYATIPPEKLLVVPSGFEPADFRDHQPVHQTKFTITHFGSFYDGRSPSTFLEALTAAIAEHRGLGEDIRVLFFGAFDVDMMQATRASLDRHALKDVVRLEGIVPYREGAQHLMNSHVLLLVAFTEEPMRHTVPAKLFDYLGAGRTILALAPDGETRRIVQAAKAGVVADPTDVRAIKDAIVDLYGRWKTGRLAYTVDPVVAKSYTWAELTRRLAAALEDAVVSFPRARTAP